MQVNLSDWLRQMSLDHPDKPGLRLAADEIERLRTERAAEREQLRLANIDCFNAEAERDALRELLRQTRSLTGRFATFFDDINDSIDAALKGEPQ